MDTCEDIFIVDSKPLPICKIARAKRSKICREDYDAMPDTGYCASQKSYFHGYKLHSVCSLAGVIFSYDLSPASVHDVNYLQDIKQNFSHCTMIGDRGYIGIEQQLNLFETRRIELQTPMRRNQKNFRPQAHMFSKSRRRIETLFSQIDDQFLTIRNYAKTFAGLRTRIASKITAFTIIQYMNKFIHNRPINHVKHALA